MLGKTLRFAAALLTLCGSSAMAAGATATTFHVNCGGKTGFTSIGAALKALQSVPIPVPVTIVVSGACKENVVIQSQDRLTLQAIDGASVSDASGGQQDVIGIFDSRDVSIIGFTVNASPDGGNGISCGDWSSCRFSKNVVQGAASGAGLSVFQASLAAVDGDTVQNNFIGLQVLSGAKVRLGGDLITASGNARGIVLQRGAFAFLSAIVENSSDVGVVVRWQSTLELTGSTISGSGSIGAFVSDGSMGRFTFSTITGNAGGGVSYGDLSLGNFAGTTVSGNGGQTDVLCNPQFSATRGAGTVGGTTNCVEP